MFLQKIIKVLMKKECIFIGRTHFSIRTSTDIFSTTLTLCSYPLLEIVSIFYSVLTERVFSFTVVVNVEFNLFEDQTLAR